MRHLLQTVCYVRRMRASKKTGRKQCNQKRLQCFKQTAIQTHWFKVSRIKDFFDKPSTTTFRATFKRKYCKLENSISFMLTNSVIIFPIRYLFCFYRENVQLIGGGKNCNYCLFDSRNIGVCNRNPVRISSEESDDKVSREITQSIQ